MRLLLLVLVILTLAIQSPLWWGKDSWSRVAELEARVAEQQAENEALKMRNNALVAEVHDLRSGTAAVEERARSELGMVKQGDVFVRILRSDTSAR
jgi:cell division protein FtsB